AIVEKVEKHVKTHDAKAGDKLPRVLNEISFPMAGKTCQRNAMPYTLWMLQGVKDTYLSFDEKEKQTVDEWLAQYKTNQRIPSEGWDPVSLNSIDLGPKLERLALGTKLA
ncbi:MAG: hypothetical protein HKN40_08830, partial [Winogradskyella sp.]|uniref:hypothetical protein n=1 Tax=Winogradskyella sp. TaxID=1883156 RepID=UPI0017BFA451|nr:hypothetical protein [Winogradskyella sp.]